MRNLPPNFPKGVSAGQMIMVEAPGGQQVTLPAVAPNGKVPVPLKGCNSDAECASAVWSKVPLGCSVQNGREFGGEDCPKVDQ